MIVIGVGNAYRGDDGAGLALARLLRERGAVEVAQSEGEPIALLDTWAHARAVVLIDAVHSGAHPGTIHRYDASTEALPSTIRGSTSTHAVGLADTIELARTLGRLPERVIVYAIEGENFHAGEELSAAVAGALESAALRITAETHQLAGAAERAER